MTPLAIFSIAELLIIVGIVWRGGHMIGKFEATQRDFHDALIALTKTQADQGELLRELYGSSERIAGIVDGVEKRVSRIEHRLDTL